MSVIERDPVTGYTTTGHDWNGIKELNSPIPRAVIIFIIVTHIAALIGWIMLPTWPLGRTFTKGLLQIDQKTDLAADIAAANTARAEWMAQMTTLDFDAIRADPVLMARALETAAPIFGQNCEACHGKDGIGGPGFPRLSDSAWIWGSTADDIAETITVGINSEHPDSRFAQMPAFGRDEMLDRDQISMMTTYVQTLSGGVIADDPSEAAILFQDNCAACHGEDGLGAEGTDAPNLTDATWTYGGDAASIWQTLMNGRQGHMPTWQNRLSTADIRMLALYVEAMPEKLQ